MIEADLTDLPDAVRSHYGSRYPELGAKLQRFDIRIYFEANPDVAGAASSPEDLIRHFCEFGHRECRLYAEGVTYFELFSEAFPHLVDRLRGFDPREYGRANRDVGGPGSSPRDFFEHFCRYGAKELRVRRDDGRIPDRRDAVLRCAGRLVDLDIRVYSHVFFPDAGLALTPYLRNLAAMGGRIALSFSELTFSTSEMERYAAAVSAEVKPDVEFETAPRQGRDWGGFYRLWQKFPPDRDSAVFFLHSKKSLHMAPIVGEMWRNELLGPICGSYGAILDAADRLRSGYSMVGSALHRSRNVGANRDLILELRPLLGLTGDTDEVEFVGGTMFAVRGQVLNDFFRLLGTTIDFHRPGTDGNPFDGSLAHACERLIGYFAATQAKGIAWVL
jgi:Rhamnan synthesis protein F